MTGSVFNLINTEARHQGFDRHVCIWLRFSPDASKSKRRAANTKPTRTANAYAIFLKAEFPAFKVGDTFHASIHSRMEKVHAIIA